VFVLFSLRLCTYRAKAEEVQPRHRAGLKFQGVREESGASIDEGLVDNAQLVQKSPPPHRRISGPFGLSGL
jgi:hypothetical protein